MPVRPLLVCKPNKDEHKPCAYSTLGIPRFLNSQLNLIICLQSASPSCIPMSIVPTSLVSDDMAVHVHTHTHTLLWRH